MSKVRWPPVLRIRHQGLEVLDHRIQIKGFGLFGVIEFPADWNLTARSVAVHANTMQRDTDSQP
jgi:hypothetical protein